MNKGIYIIITKVHTDWDTVDESAVLVLKGTSREAAEAAYLDAINATVGVACTVELRLATVADVEEVLMGDLTGAESTASRFYDSRAMCLPIPDLPPRPRTITPGPLSVPEERLPKYLPGETP